MTPAEWERVTGLFDQVLASPDGAGTALAGESAEVRAEVERLVASHLQLQARPERQGRHRAGQVLASRYRFERLLGAGGSGEAWLSSDLARDGAWVVVKVPHSWEWFRQDLKRRFAVESETLRRLSHPAIVSILAVGESEDGAPFLVMPYIDGQPLRTLLEIGPLPAEVAAQIWEALGDAIGYAHRNGVMHRDIKPENVMIQGSGAELQMHLIDFGIAQFGELEQQSSTTTRFFGTTQYMAPEQLLGQPSLASDLYAFALVAYEMAVGKPLFEASPPAALYEQQRKLRESSLDAVAAWPLRRLLLSGLDPDPRKRPRDAAGYGRELAQAIRDPASWHIPRRALLAGGLAVVPAAGWLAWRYRPAPDSERHIRYQGGQTFSQIGWKRWGQVDSDIVELDRTHARIIGNRLVSRNQGGYYYPLSEPAQRRAVNRDWSVSARLGVTHGYAAIALFLRDLKIKFVLSVAIPDAGPPMVEFLTVNYPKIESMSRTVRLPIPGELALLEMRYDSAHREASAWYQGEKVLEAYRGSTEYVDTAGLVTGVGQRLSELGEGVVGDIQFDMD
ncbi:MAG: serine/threonine protein kinase [Acidobacteriia bacterium]|nr:serine/threonine protein kinase [Terriglobia bacterium]